MENIMIGRAYPTLKGERIEGAGIAVVNFPPKRIVGFRSEVFNFRSNERGWRSYSASASSGSPPP